MKRLSAATIVVSFTTDEEAGFTYGMARRLQHEKLISSYNMFDDHAFLFVSNKEDVDNICTTVNNEAAKRGLRGTRAEED